MEKIPKKSPEYFLIKKEFDAVIENITREKNFDKFVGGLPVTLERKDIFTILSKDLSKNFRYSVTQKADGIRLLMFANYKTGTENRLRNITFIDRNNDFYTLKNRNRDPFPNFNALPSAAPKVLIDGELIIYDTENESRGQETSFVNIKSFSFMAFDILYGPISIEYSGPPNNKKLTIGSEGAMAGPIGGKMWSYDKRYSILYALLVPNSLNDYRPILSLSFKDCGWFIPEIKPLFFINQLKTSKILYDPKNKKAFFQEALVLFRTKFYKEINALRNVKIEMHLVKLDGLIFTPWATEYVIGGPWKKFLNVQYKWKPIYEQSIDFAIFRNRAAGMSPTILLKVQKGPELDTFTTRIRGKIIPARVSKESQEALKKVKDGTIGEFTKRPNSIEFDLLRLRPDKDRPNALGTALSVLNAIKYPVDLEIIKTFFIINHLNSVGLKSLLEYIKKSQLLRCIINNTNMELFNEKTKAQIIDNIKTFKTNNAYEFEIRFGTIEPDKFQANLPFNFYKQIIDGMQLLYPMIKYEYFLYADFKKNEIRTRAMYLDSLGTWTKLGSIEKQSIKHINIDLKYIYNIDVRYSLSNEKPSIEDVNRETSEFIFEKKRYSFIFPELRLDCTEIYKINKKTNKKDVPKFQVEIEVIDRKLPDNQIYNKINEVLINLLGLINS